MIELVALGPQAGFDVPLALPIRQLCESHNAELVQAGEVLGAEVALALPHAALKGF